MCFALASRPLDLVLVSATVLERLLFGMIGRWLESEEGKKTNGLAGGPREREGEGRPAETSSLWKTPTTDHRPPTQTQKIEHPEMHFQKAASCNLQPELSGRPDNLVRWLAAPLSSLLCLSSSLLPPSACLPPPVCVRLAGRRERSRPLFPPSSSPHLPSPPYCTTTARGIQNYSTRRRNIPGGYIAALAGVDRGLCDQIRMSSNRPLLERVARLLRALGDDSGSGMVRDQAVPAVLPCLPRLLHPATRSL